MARLPGIPDWLEQFEAVQELANFGFIAGEGEFLVKEVRGNSIVVFSRSRQGPVIPMDLNDPVEVQIQDRDGRPFFFLSFKSVVDFIRHMSRG